MFDLHTHTNCSDGALDPAALLARAAERGVKALSITDHDTVAAYAQTGCWKATEGDGRLPTLIPGIEFSSNWGSVGVHVLGLNIDPGSDAMTQGVRQQSHARTQRASKIDEALQRHGISGAFAGAQKIAGEALLGRVHFARYLLEQGTVASLPEAFKRYLGDGKAGDIRQHWAELPQVIEWIRGAGGIAVLAHPLKYKLTRSRLRRLLEAFMEAGGEGMEVISGRQLRHFTQSTAELCADFGLLASCGSDFHQPGPAWSELGAFGELPRGVTPVWDRF